jgi:2-dehydro-3-deoxygluconokinase
VHSGGIFSALSETTGEVIIDAMKAAKTAGAVTSFDVNYRAKLWNIWGGQEKAVSIVRRIVENVDVLVGNEEDLQLGLGIPGPEVAAKSKLDPSAFFRHDRQGRQRNTPALRLSLPPCARCILPTITVGAAVAWINGDTYVLSPTCRAGCLRPGRRRRWLCLRSCSTDC